MGRGAHVCVEKLNAHTSSVAPPDASQPPTTTIRSRVGSEIAAGEPRGDGPSGASTRVQDSESKEKIHTSLPALYPPNITAFRLERSSTAARVQRGEGPGPATCCHPCGAGELDPPHEMRINKWDAESIARKACRHALSVTVLIVRSTMRTPTLNSAHHLASAGWHGENVRRTRYRFQVFAP